MMGAAVQKRQPVYAARGLSGVLLTDGFRISIFFEIRFRDIYRAGSKNPTGQRTSRDLIGADIMEYETARIAKVTGKCPACEEYAERNSTTPPKIAVMACEGACSRGEVARRAANLVAHRLARDETVRIC